MLYSATKIAKKSCSILSLLVPFEYNMTTVCDVTAVPVCDVGRKRKCRRQMSSSNVSNESLTHGQRLGG
jgi:hypothetical protein